MELPGIELGKIAVFCLVNDTLGPWGYMRLHETDLGKHGAPSTVSIGLETMKPPPSGAMDSDGGGVVKGGVMTDEEARASDPTELAGIASADTESVYAWALDEDDEAETLPRRLTPRRITALAVTGSLLAVVAAAVIAMTTLREHEELAGPAAAPEQTTQVASPAPSAPSASRATAPPPPEDPFIAELRRYGVPVSQSDPQWTINLAHALCDTAQDPVTRYRYPPGGHTITVLTNGLRENDPTLTWQQAFRLTNSAVDHYCPEVRGPSQQQIAAMAPEPRYLALLQDRLGITPVDSTLVASGRQVCDLKAQGWMTGQIVDAMNGPNSREDEQAMVEAATEVFCPQHRDR